MKIDSPQPISHDAWSAMVIAHRARAEAHTLPVRSRRARGARDPVGDFLFQYYPYPLSLLERWHPGIGVVLAVKDGWENDLSPELHHFENGGIRLDPSRIPDKKRERFAWIGDLLAATHERSANFACHGMHEWAMVYQAEDVRHSENTPLRLTQPEIDAFVRSRPIACSHHDAFRFFAKSARNLNRLQPTLDSRIAMEQPGCVHANMDLYKWAAKLMPWCGSDLLLDTFELALELRELDMRASPYDLRNRGLDPIKIETPEGRCEYETLQRQLSSRARPLRQRLINVCAVIAGDG
ncbi:MAG: 3-methyladenine DNA glycosylase [Luteolibacter sp.]